MKKQQEEKRDFCLRWIKRVDAQFDDINTHREDSLMFVNGDPAIVAIIKGRSELVTTDLQDAIDIAKPDILESIAGTDEPLKLDPTGPEDVEAVKRLQLLGNIMIRRRNKWFRLCADFLDDSMKLKVGFFKYRWVSEDKTIEKEYENLTDIELSALLEKPGASLVGVDPDTGMTKIAYSQKDEYVSITGVPSENLRFPLDTRDFDNVPFVVEEVRYYRHEIIKNYGLDVLEKIEKEVESLKAPGDNSVEVQRYADVGGIEFLYDEKEQKYSLYECYFPDEKTGKPWIFAFIGETVVMDEENKYGKPPYRGGSPFLLAHRLIGKDYFDYLKEIQKQRTFFKRQIFDNVTQANYRRYFGDPERMNLDDYLNNNATNALIRVQGDPSTVVMGEQKAPLPPEVLEFWELLNVEKDYHIPTPRSFQGVNPQVLNKTYRGQNQQVQQASKKLLMMIRGYMEDVFAPLFSDVLDCIMKFMTKTTTIRYLNEDYDITPDNVICKYDMTVNVGLGAQDKNDVIVKLQQLIGLMFQATQAGMGVVTPKNVHYVFQELIRAMGFLNTTDFLTDPDFKTVITEFVTMVQTLIEAMAEVPQLQGMVAAMIPEFQAAVGKVMGGLGVQVGLDPGGQNTKGTAPGQNTPTIPDQPFNPGNPMTQITGGGFWA